ncbi:MULTISPECIES: CDC27 family protein [unclassified Campylobacter]|uniref:CDC27 family protein n=1 Tax=Campylobacter TaxID=194 RepID=UPI0020160782|nr:MULTISPECIES: CDC27 family protein [unclassified Campylobacter]QKF93093.1 putative tetratricopeptide repeat lipoprotein [Campylobacter sp. CCUG 57310]
MDIFFIEFRDPIFGLVVFVSLVLMIAVLSYIWGVFRNKDEKQELEKFLKKFDKTEGLSSEHKDMLVKFDVDSASLCFLANTFAKSGYFEKAINIYSIALSKAKSKSEKEPIFTDLGQVFFKAGFLQKARDIFLEALKLSPRNQTALKFLTVVYEKLKEYDEALNALDALEELGLDVKSQKAYIDIMKILIDKQMSLEEKTDKILKLKDKFTLANRMALENWLQKGADIVNFPDFPPLKDVFDIIYRQERAVNLSDEEYKSLFYAKNLSDEPAKELGFELEVMTNLKKAGFNKADLSFNYICKNCKNSFPLHFYRCPICHELGSAQILPHITEKSNENSMPF